MGGEKTVDKRFPKSFGREKADRGAFINLAYREELSPPNTYTEREWRRSHPTWVLSSPWRHLVPHMKGYSCGSCGSERAGSDTAIHRSTQSN